MIFSVTTVLLLLGMVLLAALLVRQVVEQERSSVELMIELRELESGEQLALQAQLAARPYLQPGSLEYISKEAAAEEMATVFEEDFQGFGLMNPLRDHFLLKLRPEYIEPDTIERIQTALQALPEVQEVIYQPSVVERLSGNLRTLMWYGGVVVLLFVGLTMVVIHNTIRLRMYADRFLIKNMQLVGAAPGFIIRPYVVRAISYGALSGVLALVALAGLLWWISGELPDILTYMSTGMLATLAGVLLAIGIAISAIGTYFTVRKYLRASLDDLY